MIKSLVLLDGVPLYRVTEVIAMEIPIPADKRERWAYLAGPAYIQWKNEDGTKGCAYVKSGKGIDGIHYERASLDEIMASCAETFSLAFKARDAR